MAKAYWDQVKQGQTLPVLTLAPITRIQIAKFAGATEDFNPLHVDDEMAKSSGFGGICAHSLMTFCFGEYALRSFADNSRILSISSTFHKLVWPGDTLSISGVVAKHYETDGEPRVDIEVTAKNQNQEVVMKGDATCVLFRNEKAESHHDDSTPALNDTTRDYLTQTYGEFIVKPSGKPPLPIKAPKSKSGG